MPESQNGRIGGGVLKDNLLRQGKDLAFDTDLLYLKVDQTIDAPTVPGPDTDDGDPNYQLGAGNTGAIAKGIGINTQAVDDDLSIPATTNPFRSSNLISTNYTNISNFTIQNSNITAFGNDLFLSSAGNIFATSIATDDLKIDFNTISTTTPNTNIELRPNGNGTVNINSNWNITGSLHATGNIETVGDFTFGSDDEDDVVFAANVNSDITPDQNNTSSLGSEYKRWMDIYTSLVNGEAIVLDELVVGNGASSLARRQGNTFYVSTLGDDTNVGDHQHGAFRTLKHALSVIDGSTAGPTAIHIYPGVYEEEFPLTVPSHVDIIGEDLRNTIIEPTYDTSTNTAFYVEDDVTIENLTIRDFFSPGYAFEFTPNGLVNTRSPYIKNVTVITKGSSADTVVDILDGGDATTTVFTEFVADTPEIGSLTFGLTVPTAVVPTSPVTGTRLIERMSSPAPFNVNVADTPVSFSVMLTVTVFTEPVADTLPRASLVLGSIVPIEPVALTLPRDSTMLTVSVLTEPVALTLPNRSDRSISKPLIATA